MFLVPLSLSHSRLGGRSPPRSSPGSSIGVLRRFGSGDLAMTPATPGRVLGSVTPDVLTSHQHHCNVHNRRSLGVRYGVGRPPTMENGLCAAVPHWSPVQSRGQQQCGCSMSVNTRWMRVCGSLSYLVAAMACWLVTSVADAVM